MDSIKKQIIDRVVTRAESIAGGPFTWNIINVEKGIKYLQNTDLPAIFIFPIKTENPGQAFNSGTFELEISLQALVEFGSENPLDVAEQLEADMYEAFFGVEYEIDYTSGSLSAGYSVSDIPGVVATNAGSAKSYTIKSVITDLGDWASGTAEGSMIVIRPDALIPFSGLTTLAGGMGSFSSSDVQLSEINQLESIFGPSLEIEEISFISSGVDNWSETDDTTVATSMNIMIRYYIKYGNPYEQ